MIGGIGEVLRFQGDSGAVVVLVSAFSGVLAVHEVAAVELDAGLVCIDGEVDSGLGFVEFCGFGDGFGITGRFVQNPVLVIAFAVFQGCVSGVDALANLGGFAEVKRGSCDGGKFSCSNEFGIRFCEAIPVDFQ